MLILDDYRRGTAIRDILCDWCISGSTLTWIIRKAREPLRAAQRRNGKRRQYLKRQEAITKRAQPCSGAPNTRQPSNSSSRNSSSVLPIGP